MNELRYQPTLQDALGITKELAADITALTERVESLELEIAELRSKGSRIGWTHD